jgi:hypothetical protein
MRKFRATTLQDGSTVPWVFELPPIPTAIPVWGVNIVPQAIYASYDENYIGQGEPLYYEWNALLAPEVALPDWITEVTPTE